MMNAGSSAKSVSYMHWIVICLALFPLLALLSAACCNGELSDSADGIFKRIGQNVED